MTNFLKAFEEQHFQSFDNFLGMYLAPSATFLTECRSSLFTIGLLNSVLFWARNVFHISE